MTEIDGEPKWDWGYENILYSRKENNNNNRKLLCCVTCTFVTMTTLIMAMTFITMVMVGYGVTKIRKYDHTADHVEVTIGRIRSVEDQFQAILKNITNVTKDIPSFVEIGEMFVNHKKEILELLPFVLNAKKCLHDYHICPNV